MLGQQDGVQLDEVRAARQRHVVASGFARPDRSAVDEERGVRSRPGDELEVAVLRYVDESDQRFANENLAESVPGPVRLVIRRRQVEKPDRQLTRVAIAPRHHRRTDGIVGKPVGANIPRMRLARAFADHRLGRIEGEAPPLLLQRQRCADFKDEDGPNEHSGCGATQERRMQPRQQRDHQSQCQRFHCRVEGRTIKNAAQAARPQDGQNGEQTPHQGT